MQNVAKNFNIYISIQCLEMTLLWSLIEFLLRIHVDNFYERSTSLNRSKFFFCFIKLGQKNILIDWKIKVKFWIRLCQIALKLSGKNDVDHFLKFWAEDVKNPEICFKLELWKSNFRFIFSHIRILKAITIIICPNSLH